ncbi:MAG: aminotransferase class I/II-fold pyridoxal phosphate-dependent enzyme [Deltaproteobacteria bacterium]|nr:aminotransferase class I/II-fold pyridoxal phosphate-dependent enzyme [Deltaproteobacteria bacterium]
MKPIQLASSLSQVTPSRIRQLADIAFSMEGVLRLHFGESNLPTPQFIKDAAAEAMSVSISKPEGAFYLFPRINGVKDSFAFALSLLKETKVSVAPGAAFGNGGEGAIRICCAAERSVLEPAMERIVGFLEKK